MQEQGGEGGSGFAGRVREGRDASSHLSAGKYCRRTIITAGDVIKRANNRSQLEDESHTQAACMQRRVRVRCTAGAAERDAMTTCDSSHLSAPPRRTAGEKCDESAPKEGRACDCDL